MFKIIILLISIVFCLSAEKYYYSQSGSDATGTGAIELPFKTMSHLNGFGSTLNPGDTMFLKRGDTWREQLTLPENGTADFPYVIIPYGDTADGYPVISGANDISYDQGYEWHLSSSGDNEYYCTGVSGVNPTISNVSALWINGQYCFDKTAGSLVNYEYDYTDNDALGFNTVYAKTPFSLNAVGVLVENQNRTYCVYSLREHWVLDSIHLAGGYYGVRIVNGKTRLNRCDISDIVAWGQVNLCDGVVLTANRFGDCWSNSYGMQLSGAGDPIIEFNLFTGSKSTALDVKATGNCYIVNNTFDGIRGHGIYGNGTGLYLYINNNTFTGSGVGQLQSVYSATFVTGSAVEYTYNNTLPNGVNPSYMLNNITEGIGCLNVDPQFTKTRHQGFYSFTMDDYIENMVYFLATVPEFEAYNGEMKYDYSLHRTDIISDSDWDTIVKYSEMGILQVALHTRDHTDMREDTAFSIQYTGTGTAAALTITNDYTNRTGSFVSIITGDAGSNITENFTSLSRIGNSTDDLVHTINSMSGYTCLLKNSYNYYSKSLTLDDVSSIDIKSGVYHVKYDTSKFYREEIDSCLYDFTSRGLTVRSGAFPGGYWDNNVIKHMKDAGMWTCRTTTPTRFGMDSINIFAVGNVGLTGQNYTDTELKIRFLGMLSTIAYCGGFTTDLQHQPEDYKYATILSTADEYTGRVRFDGMDSAALWIRENGFPENDDSLVWRVIQVDSSDYALRSTSELINAGNLASIQLVPNLYNMSGDQITNKTGVIQISDISIGAYSTESVDSLVPAIRVLNDNLDKDTVHIGQLCIFDASETIYLPEQALTRGFTQYRWDFGDGYKIDTVQPYNPYDMQGVCVAHCFMDTGLFTVKLKATVYDSFTAGGDPIYSTLRDKDSTSKAVYITGAPVPDSFYVAHSPFNARKEMWMDARFPAHWKDIGYNFDVLLNGPGASDVVLYSVDGITSGAQYKFLFSNYLYDAGSYVITATVSNSADVIDSGQWVEKFTKTCDGVPHVSIDKNNSIRVDDTLYFPYSTFLTDAGVITARRDSAHLNCLFTEGWVETPSSGTFATYLSQAKSAGLNVMGPGHPSGHGYEEGLDYIVDESNVSRRHRFNNHPDSIVSYINTSKDSVNLLAFQWFDEPNLGSWGDWTYSPSLLAWHYLVGRYDGTRPGFNSIMIGDWSNAKSDLYQIYDYETSSKWMGGKRFSEDMFGGDGYCFNYRGSTAYNQDTAGPVSLYMTSLDKIHDNNSFIPFQPVQEIAVLNDSYDTISPAETRMMLWANVIYGHAKAIVLFQYWHDPYNWVACRDFIDTLNMYKNLILGDTTSRTVTDNSNSKLNRVESMLREDGDTTYLFSVRITEPDTISGTEIKYKGVEPDSIFTTIEISGISTANTVVSSSGKTLSTVDGIFVDTFLQNDVTIYKIFESEEPTVYTLSVTSTGTGSGTIVLDPVSGIVAPGDPVSATAIASDGSVFVGYSGDTTTSESTISWPEMDASKNVIATFTLAPIVDSMRSWVDYGSYAKYARIADTITLFGQNIGDSIAGISVNFNSTGTERISEFLRWDGITDTCTFIVPPGTVRGGRKTRIHNAVDGLLSVIPDSTKIYIFEPGSN